MDILMWWMAGVWLVALVSLKAIDMACSRHIKANREVERMILATNDFYEGRWGERMGKVIKLETGLKVEARRKLKHANRKRLESRGPAQAEEWEK